MEINLSNEMVRVIYQCLRHVPITDLESICRGDDYYRVDGIEAFELFETLVQDLDKPHSSLRPSPKPEPEPEQLPWP